MTRCNLVRGSPAPLIHLKVQENNHEVFVMFNEDLLAYHLCPLMTISSPSLLIEVRMLVASEEATIEGNH